MTHIDTAEFYGWGKSEKIVGEVVKEYPRDMLFITSKLFPVHISKRAMLKAANKSLKRLGLKYFDLFLIHFPSIYIPIKKQMNVLEELYNQGNTRYIGVSNFSVKQFREAQTCLKTTQLVNNQLNANVGKQKHILDSLEYYQKHNIIMTAYSPFAHRGLSNLDSDIKRDLEKIAMAHDATIHQIAIAWLINHENVITIPKAFKKEHVEANATAAELRLTNNEVNFLYKNFKKIRNEMPHLVNWA